MTSRHPLTVALEAWDRPDRMRIGAFLAEAADHLAGMTPEQLRSFGVVVQMHASGWFSDDEIASVPAEVDVEFVTWVRERMRAAVAWQQELDGGV